MSTERKYGKVFIYSLHGNTHFKSNTRTNYITDRFNYLKMYNVCMREGSLHITLLYGK